MLLGNMPVDRISDQGGIDWDTLLVMILILIPVQMLVLIGISGFRDGDRVGWRDLFGEVYFGTQLIVET